MMRTVWNQIEFDAPSGFVDKTRLVFESKNITLEIDRCDLAGNGFRDFVHDALSKRKQSASFEVHDLEVDERSSPKTAQINQTIQTVAGKLCRHEIWVAVENVVTRVCVSGAESLEVEIAQHLQSVIDSMEFESSD